MYKVFWKQNGIPVDNNLKLFIHRVRREPTIKDKSVETFEQNKRFLSAFVRNFKKHPFRR